MRICYLWKNYIFLKNLGRLKQVTWENWHYPQCSTNNWQREWKVFCEICCTNLVRYTLKDFLEVIFFKNIFFLLQSWFNLPEWTSQTFNRQKRIQVLSDFRIIIRDSAFLIKWKFFCFILNWMNRGKCVIFL